MHGSDCPLIMQVREAGEEAWLGRPAPEVPELDYSPQQASHSLISDANIMAGSTSSTAHSHEHHSQLSAREDSGNRQIGQALGELCTHLPENMRKVLATKSTQHVCGMCCRITNKHWQLHKCTFA